MPNNSKTFKHLKVAIIVLVIILVAINILYLITACTSRQCFIVNVSTVALLLWATALWIIVLRYSKKDK